MKRYDMWGPRIVEDPSGEYLKRDEVIEAIYRCGLMCVPKAILSALGITSDEWTEILKKNIADTIRSELGKKKL